MRLTNTPIPDSAHRRHYRIRLSLPRSVLFCSIVLPTHIFCHRYSTPLCGQPSPPLPDRIKSRSGSSEDAPFGPWQTRKLQRPKRPLSAKTLCTILFSYMKTTVKYRYEERCIFLLNFEIFHSILENVAFYIFANGLVQGLPRTFVINCRQLCRGA